MAEAYIVAAARTAGGRKGGRLAGWHPADLAATSNFSAVEFLPLVSLLGTMVFNREAATAVWGR